MKHYHRLTKRGKRVAGWLKGDGALALAARAHAKSIGLYHAIEDNPLLRSLEPRSRARGLLHVSAQRPRARRKHDHGLFGIPRRRCEEHGKDITGVRPYGKNRDRARPPKLKRWVPQRRLAYCAIRRWAIEKNYFGAGPLPEDMKNSCRRPKERGYKDETP